MQLGAGSAPARMEPVAIDMTVVPKAIAPLSDSIVQAWQGAARH